ncbi:MAG: hypothetical protein ACKVZJ_10870 [Phycisphaerales bacterium]
MGRLETIAIAALLAFAGWQYVDHLRSELRERKAELSVKAEEIKTLRDEARAAEIGRAVAESAKERVREVVRTVAVPAQSAACSADPARPVAYFAIERMRRAAEGGPAHSPVAGDQPARGTVSDTRPVG